MVLVTGSAILANHRSVVARTAITDGNRAPILGFALSMDRLPASILRRARIVGHGDMAAAAIHGCTLLLSLAGVHKMRIALGEVGCSGWFLEVGR